MGPDENATVMDSVDHSHTGLARKLDVFKGVARMDGFSDDEYMGKTGTSVSVATDARGKQYANLVMSHIDCRTIPFFWRYANRFTLFDNIFATEDTPSTPNAIAMIAGQSGETQWVKHGTAGRTQPLSGTINGVDYDGRTGTTQGPPIVGDPQPFWGSQFDTSIRFREPTSPIESYAAGNIASNMTFATVLLTLAGKGVRDVLSTDRNPASNQADIQNDIPAIFATGNNARLWGWYQNGFDHEPYDAGDTASHVGYVSHHQGPQYFGYLANNPREQTQLHGEGDFFTDVADNRLPPDGGVFYIRGGYQNLQGLRTAVNTRSFPSNAKATGGLTDTDVATIQTAKAGDDDHPGYSDHQITEAMNARVINAIAANPTLWAQSAIVVTYDESDGFYDHVPPRILSYGPDGLPLSRGVRVPLLVISPYARTHVVSHAEGDHNAIIETINAIFDLPALSSLPDEAAALAAGNSAAFNEFADANAPAGFAQAYLGPRDTNSSITDSPAVGLRSAAPPRHGSDAPGHLRDDPGRDGERAAALRHAGLPGDRRRPRRPAAGPLDAAAGELQLAAIDATGLQHPGAAIERERHLRAGLAAALAPGIAGHHAEVAVALGPLRRRGSARLLGHERPGVRRRGSRDGARIDAGQGQATRLRALRRRAPARPGDDRRQGALERPGGSRSAGRSPSPCSALRPATRSTITDRLRHMARCAPARISSPS